MQMFEAFITTVKNRALWKKIGIKKTDKVIVGAGIQ